MEDKKLMDEIIKYKERLQEMMEESTIITKEIIETSQQLDELIIKFYKNRSFTAPGNMKV